MHLVYLAHHNLYSVMMEIIITANTISVLEKSSLAITKCLAAEMLGIVAILQNTNFILTSPCQMNKL